VPQAVACREADEDTVHPEPDAVGMHRVVDKPQKGRLAGTGRPDQAQNLAALHLERDALQHLVRTETLRYALRTHHRDTVCADVGHLLSSPSVLRAGLVTVATDSVSTVVVPFFSTACPTPRENRFSRKYWPTIRSEVNSRYQAHATSSNGIGSKMTAEMSLDRP